MQFIEKYTELLLNYELLNLLGKGGVLKVCRRFAAASLPRLKNMFDLQLLQLDVRLSAQMVVFTFI